MAFKGMLSILLESPDPTEKPFRLSIEIDQEQWREYGFAPLPQNHDVPFDFWARQAAQEQLERRDAGIRQLSYTFMLMLRQALEKRDPVDGYYPGERNA